MLPSALPGSIRCAAACGTTFASGGPFDATDNYTVAAMRHTGWQVVNGEWACPNDLPGDRRGACY